MGGFFDYCVPESCLRNNQYEITVKQLYEWGYRTIAVNQFVEEIDANSKKKKKGFKSPGCSEVVPEPFKIKSVQGCEDLTILNRLTIMFSSQDELHQIVQSVYFKKYHIIAVLPKTKAALCICTTFDADILCFNPENRNYIKSSDGKLYKQLIKMGLHFEIPYSPAIEDSTKRKNIIHMAHMYHTLCNSTNIIISSAASNPILLRGPYDVINLALIFGLNEQRAKDAISHNGQQVFISSEGRRCGKAVMFIENFKPEEKLKDDRETISIIETVDIDEDMTEGDPPAIKKIKQQ